MKNFNVATFFLKNKSIMLRFLIGAVMSLGIFAVFLLTQHQNPFDVYKAIIFCYVGNQYNVGEICVHMTPILMCSLAAAIPAKVGLSNCGGEGQLIAGALAANVTGVYLFYNCPTVIGLPLVFISGILAGIICGLIPLLGKMYLNMNETLSTLLMNYLVVKLVAYLVYGPIKDPAGNNYPMSARIPEQLKIQPFSGTRGTYTIIIAIIIAIIVWYVLNKTEMGFKIKVVGGNSKAAEFAGYKVKKIQCASFLLASGLAGLAGAFSMSSVEIQVRETTGSGYGFMGFLSAGIVDNNPLLSVVSSFMLSALKACGSTLELTTGLRSAASLIFMSIILLTIFALGKRRKA